ncbi:hypothetical protein [Ornithinibacillus sp. FSL M8-0202]|uniref:hypothetical protein n=1 Tax=Ornithinibacillus sp. FSL M8-0202 TaxID=2921616 RepID=UPI0030CB0E7B
MIKSLTDILSNGNILFVTLASLATILGTFILRPSFITFFQSNTAEKKITSKEFEFFYRTLIFITLFILIPILLQLSPDNVIFDFLLEINPNFLFLTLFVYLAISLIFLWRLPKDFHKIKVYQKERTFLKRIMDFLKKRFLFYFLLITTMLMTYVSIFIISLIYFQLYSLEEPMMIYTYVNGTIAIILLSIIFFLPTYLSFNYLLTPNIRINKLVLNNYEPLEEVKDYYLLHRTFNGYFLIGDHPSKQKCKNTILIKNESIIIWDLEQEYKFTNKNPKK